MRALRILPLAVLLSLLPTLAAAELDETSRSWNQPVEPFRIAENLYYVGASDVTSFLITTPQGHILLDSGFEETVPLIRESVKKLGFQMKDVKILLNNHAHVDHAGGLAALKQLTGAQLVVGEGDAPLLAAGGKGDFAFGDKLTFPPVRADRTVRDGDTVSLGGATLTARITPGHTKGCTTWTMKVDGPDGRTLDVVFAGSASVNPGVILVKNPKYPEIAEDYARTFEVLKSLPCDIFLSSHGSFFHLKEKAERVRKGETGNPFVDPEGYRSYVERMEGRYRKQLEEEKKGRKPAAAPPPPATAQGPKAPETPRLHSGPQRVGGPVSAPELTSSVPPEVPEVARKAKVEGTVYVEAVIDREGNVTRTKILKGLPMGLDQAAVNAVKQWKFKPAMAYGKPVDVYHTVTVAFPPK